VNELRGVFLVHRHYRAVVQVLHAQSVDVSTSLLSDRTADVREAFCRNLHKKMFGQTQVWAGTFRQSDKNIGCDWTQVSVNLRNLFDNTRWWVDNGTFPPDEIAARFHRDLVWLHPFPNGNGRHSRMMADALLRSMKQDPFS
jgi:Fic-DOC domain mobile mystery protein B